MLPRFSGSRRVSYGVYGTSRYMFELQHSTLLIVRVSLHVWPIQVALCGRVCGGLRWHPSLPAVGGVGFMQHSHKFSARLSRDGMLCRGTRPHFVDLGRF